MAIVAGEAGHGYNFVPHGILCTCKHHYATVFRTVPTSTGQYLQAPHRTTQLIVRHQAITLLVNTGTALHKQNKASAGRRTATLTWVTRREIAHTRLVPALELRMGHTMQRCRNICLLKLHSGRQGIQRKLTVLFKSHSMSHSPTSTQQKLQVQVPHWHRATAYTVPPTALHQPQVPTGSVCTRQPITPYPGTVSHHIAFHTLPSRQPPVPTPPQAGARAEAAQH